MYLPLFILGIVLATASCKKDETPDRDKFLGAYTVVETCGSGNDSYDITIIESGTAENAVIIVNLYDFGAQISATVSGNNITIPSSTTGGITYSGNGTISGNTLTVTFTVSDGSASDNCTATCTRK